MERDRPDRVRESVTALRITLIAFVALWLFGPDALRAAVPIWIPFLVALGLELNFFVGALRAPAPPRRDPRPQAVDRERYGYSAETDDLVLVERGDEELWVPYAGDSPEELEELIEAERTRAAEPVPPPGPRTGRAVRRLAAGLAVIAALAVGAWALERRTGWEAVDAEARAASVERFSVEASRIVGRPVSIRCDESGDYVGAVQHADGVAAVGGSLAFLTPERCLDLHRLAADGDVAFSQTARAIAVLAHEAWHLRGVRDEATTECYALQSGVELGVRLGLDERTARRMMRQQLAENASRSARTAEYRVTAECRDGGRLDLKPAVSEFP